MALRAFCVRLLGWDGEQRVAVDRALRSLRMGATHRTPLVLHGDGDMVPVAHALHRRVLGADRPFALLAKVSEPGASIQLVVCESRADTAFPLSTPIEVPSLATRAKDLPRIIAEYAQDAIAALGVPAGSFEPDDHRWVLEYAAASDEIEKATLRCIALMSSASPTRAAAVLGMAPVSLSRWLGRRNLGL